MSKNDEPDSNDALTIFVDTWNEVTIPDRPLHKNPNLSKATGFKKVSQPDQVVRVASEPTTVEAKKFKANLDQTLRVLRQSFEGTIDKPVGDLNVNEIEVALEVGAEGRVGILGTGASVSGKSSIVVRFGRH